METLLITPLFTIAHDPGLGCLHLTWRGSHGEEESKACGIKILEKVRATGATKILNDSLLDEDGWGELTRWIAQDFMQQLAETGIAAAAWVLPENLRARADVHKVLVQVRCPLIETFLDVEAAYHWLKTGPIIPNPDC